MGRNIQNSKWASHQQLTAQKSEAKFNKAVEEFVHKTPSKVLEPEKEVVVPVIEEVVTEVKSEVPEATEEVVEETPIQEEPTVELKPITKKNKTKDGLNH